MVLLHLVDCRAEDSLCLHRETPVIFLTVLLLLLSRLLLDGWLWLLRSFLRRLLRLFYFLFDLLFNSGWNINSYSLNHFFFLAFG